MNRAGKWMWAAAVAFACGGVLAQADDARAKKIVSGVCSLCHGMDGESSSEIFPRLAGQHSEYIAKQLENFKSGKRESTAMSQMAATLKPEEMVALGKYFEKKKSTPTPPRDPSLASVGKYIYTSGNKYSGVPACAGCHGPDALGTSSLPRLAGQYASYTENQLNQFNKRQRTNDNAVMHTIVEKMTPMEMAAVAEYLSSR